MAQGGVKRETFSCFFWYARNDAPGPQESTSDFCIVFRCSRICLWSMWEWKDHRGVEGETFKLFLGVLVDEPMALPKESIWLLKRV